MSSDLITAPIFVLIIGGFLLGLFAIVEDTSAKTISFAEDANLALDCAFAGIPIDECSPNLLSYDFKSDLENFADLNRDFLLELREIYGDDIEIEFKDSKTLIVISK